MISTSIQQADLDYLWHGSLQHQGLAANPPLMIERGEGCYLWDTEGRRYLDAMAGLWCVNAGYGRSSIAEAAYEQMKKLAFYPLTQSHGPAAALAERLAGLLP